MEAGLAEVVPLVPPQKSAWGQVSQPLVVTSLEDVMSEELAKDLQIREADAYVNEVKEGRREEEIPASLLLETDACSSDFIIAQMLQMQYDRESDELLKKQEQKYNGTSKVSVSFSNYRKIPDNTIWAEDSDSEQCCDELSEDWDTFEKTQKTLPAIPRCGYVRQGSSLVTKHDTMIAARKNACKVMELPPGIETGDGGGFDMKLPNSAYSVLKNHTKKEQQRHARLHDKVEKSTTVMAIDPRTRILLYKLVNNQILERINGCISTGKEAVIFHADGGILEGHTVPRECALKVYKTVLSEFKTREKYIYDDNRFKDRYSKQNPRKIIHLWAEKEIHNLMKMQKAGIPCPEAVLLKKHILIMSFLGENHTPAPKLKEALLSQEEMDLAYRQTIEMTRRLYVECSLVHADLSEYNILWYKKQCLFIDVSQSVETTHSHALEFLYRDCTNISNFFSKKGVPDVKSPKQLFKETTGIELHGEGATTVAQIQVTDQHQTTKPRNHDIVSEICCEQPVKGKQSSKSPRSPKTTKSPISTCTKKKSGDDIKKKMVSSKEKTSM